MIKLMLKTYLFTKNETRQDVPLDDWKSLVEEECGLLWVDARSITEKELNHLARLFGLHALAIESCLDGYRRPHLYEFPDHFYVNMTVLKPSRNNHGFKPMEMHLFVGGRFIITIVKNTENDAVDKALEEYIDTPSLCSRGPMYGVYLLAEDLVETYYPIVENLDDEADKLESVMLERADKKSLKHNFDLKRRGFELRRLLGPQRDILNDLARRDFPFLEGENQVYFQDIYNRMIRVFDMLDTIREILSGNLDIYLSTVSNRLNEIMKVLTVAATILMILSFITGFYGMNFDYMPGLHYKYAFHVTIGLMVAITIGMMIWFKKKGWM